MKHVTSRLLTKYPAFYVNQKLHCNAKKTLPQNPIQVR